MCWHASCRAGPKVAAGASTAKRTPASVEPGRSMALIGYHVSHEQFAPSELLACVRAAELGRVCRGDVL